MNCCIWPYHLGDLDLGRKEGLLERFRLALRDTTPKDALQSIILSSTNCTQLPSGTKYVLKREFSCEGHHVHVQETPDGVPILFNELQETITTAWTEDLLPVSTLISHLKPMRLLIGV